MQNCVYLHALNHKDEILSVLNNPSFEKNVKKAKKCWTDYQPLSKECNIVGIDSSYNSIKYQGMQLWASTAHATNVSRSIALDQFKYGLDNSSYEVPAIASQLELDLCDKVLPDADMILMDGSIHSKILELGGSNGIFSSKNFNKSWDRIQFLRKAENAVYVSKTSYTNAEFDNTLGDIYYYGKVCNRAGFSRVYEDHRYGENAVICSSFVRLAECTPLLKIELFGAGHDECRIRDVMDHIMKNSVNGYPYSLRMAHDTCKVSGEDMRRFSHMYGLCNETGSRDVLR